MSDTQNDLANGTAEERQRLLHLMCTMDPEVRARMAAQLRAAGEVGMARFADLMMRYGALVDAQPKDRRREYVWEAGEIGPAGQGLTILLEELLDQALNDLAEGPYLLPHDDDDTPVGRTRSAAPGRPPSGSRS